MNRPFAESFFNLSTHRVLRARLRPLSLWHLLNLEIIQSPYFVGGTFPTARDLLLATRVCQASFPVLPVMTGWRLWTGWLKALGCSFPQESRRFNAYLKDFNALPLVWKKEDDKKAANQQPAGLPWALAIVTSVCGSTGWSAESVWNMPVGQAYWYHVAFAIQRGSSVDLVSDGELEAMERMKARKAGQNV